MEIFLVVSVGVLGAAVIYLLNKGRKREVADSERERLIRIESNTPYQLDTKRHWGHGDRSYYPTEEEARAVMEHRQSVKDPWKSWDSGILYRLSGGVRIELDRFSNSNDDFDWDLLDKRADYIDQLNREEQERRNRPFNEILGYKPSTSSPDPPKSSSSGTPRSDSETSEVTPLIDHKSVAEESLAFVLTPGSFDVESWDIEVIRRRYAEVLAPERCRDCRFFMGRLDAKLDDDSEDQHAGDWELLYWNNHINDVHAPAGYFFGTKAAWYHQDFDGDLGVWPSAELEA